MQVYDLQISSASDVERINAQGDYIYYSNGSAGGSNSAVEVRGINTGFRVNLLPGQGMRLPMGRVENDWLIKPYTAIAGSLIGSVVIGEGEIFDNRVTGSVEVINGEKNRTQAQIAFIGASDSGVLANYAAVQLWNGSTNKNVYLEQMNFTCYSTGYVNFGYTQALAMQNATLPVSKKVDSTSPVNSVAVSRFENLASASLTKGAGLMGCIGNTPTPFKFSEPIMIQPGQGFTMVSGQTNSRILTLWEFFEEPI